MAFSRASRKWGAHWPMSFERLVAAARRFDDRGA